ncbi:restriction endonuclease subunit S [Campylobacter estrildidarum]|uniref:Restriction endonuclease subunit S n=1 Tax=Campylobacter estrildidarum TaxID=2510189 RepID=A0A4U7BI01_9BACT|nr:restriction endonuclease subunit S [Campylobacter estrildidarum]TKX31478.1 restriction endonuclease subunit S [Campylobacter estrildidarum]
MTNLPQGWEVKKLGDIVKLKNGFAFKSNLFCDKGIPIVRIKNIQNENIILDDLVFCNPSDYKNDLNNYLIFKNDILIAMSGATTGKIGIYNLNDKAYLNQRIGLLRIDNSILRKYVFWFLYCNSEQNLANAFGAAQPNLNTEQIHNIQIPMPPLKEQERIVGILDESFAKIDESIKILEQDLLNLDELMQSALQKAFNPLKDKSKENYQLPQGWEWKSLGEICYITDGTHKTPQYKENGIPFLSVKNISKGFFDLSDVKYISLEEHNKLIKRAKPKFGDILICRIGTLGKAIKVCLEFEFSIFVSLGLLKPKISIISDYLVYFLNSHFIEIWINNNKVGQGTHTAKLNLSVLEKCPIAIPPLKEQEQIASYLDELSLNIKALKENYKTQIKDYEELKKSLLKKAFEGRL